MAGLKPSFMREMAGYRLGFFGVITERSRETTSAGPTITFASAEEAARREARALRALGADLVVGLCHLNYGAELALLRAVPEVDICLSGDDHIGFVYYDGKQAAMEAGANLQFLAVMDIHLSKRRSGDRDIVSWRPEPRLLSTAGATPDAALAAQVAAYGAKLDSSLNLQIGTADGEFDSRHANMVWTHPGMTTYYRNSRGRIVVNSPYRNAAFFEMSKEAKLEDFMVEPRHQA